MGLARRLIGGRVLDVGCGTGYLTRRVARAVGRRRRRACSRSPARRPAPEPDASCDVVVSSFAVHHIPADRRADAFREIHRVLRPGGRLLIADLRPTRGPSVHRVPGDVVERMTAFATRAGFRVSGI